MRRFRQGSLLAVAITGLLLMVWDQPELALGQDMMGAAPAAEVEGDPTDPIEMTTDPAEGMDRATGTLRDLLRGFYGMLPRLGVALLIVMLAGLLAHVVRAAMRRVLGEWERADAIAALARVVIYLIAIGVALSVVAGDARALIGSVGLAGLALSWALQTPIESFTGWLLNSFRGYYRVGDRIEVGEVFGDVFRIDILTTTVWEAGGPGKPVSGAQPTGAMITFPNWEVLRSNIVNYSSDFPFVWDEVSVAIANESDMAYTKDVLETVARGVFGDRMATAAANYRTLLQQARIAFDVAEQPQVFLSGGEAWTDFTIRYLVDARQRRRWSSDLNLAIAIELGKPEHRGRIIDGYPVRALHIRSGQSPASPEPSADPQ